MDNYLHEGAMNMATRKVYVNPGDTLMVHVITDPELERTAREWASQVRPERFLLGIERRGVSLSDPNLDVYMQMAGIGPRRLMLQVVQGKEPVGLRHVSTPDVDALASAMADASCSPGESSWDFMSDSERADWRNAALLVIERYGMQPPATVPDHTCDTCQHRETPAGGTPCAGCKLGPFPAGGVDCWKPISGGA